MIVPSARRAPIVRARKLPPVLSEKEYLSLAEIAGKDSWLRLGTQKPGDKSLKRMASIATDLKSDKHAKRKQVGFSARRLATEQAFAKAVVGLEASGLNIQMKHVVGEQDGHLGFAFSGIDYKGQKYVDHASGKPRNPNLNYVDAFAREMYNTPEGVELAEKFKEWRRSHLKKYSLMSDYFEKHRNEMILAAQAVGRHDIAKDLEKRSLHDQRTVISNLDRFTEDYINGVRAWRNTYELDKESPEKE